MISRWVTPAVCYSLLVVVEVLAVGAMLLPASTVLAFIGLYLLVPALSLLLSLLLGASSARLPLKLAFPPVALGGILLGYLFSTAAEGGVVDLRYLASDCVLALIFALLPALLGTAVGLVARAVTSRSGMRKGTGARASAGTRAGTRTTARAGTGRPARSTPRLSASPKLRVLPRGGTGTGKAGAGQPGMSRPQAGRTQASRTQTGRTQAGRTQTGRTQAGRTQSNSAAAAAASKQRGGSGSSGRSGSGSGKPRRYRRT